MSISRLNQNHKNACLAIAHLRPRAGGATHMDYQEFDISMSKYFEDNDDCYAFGYFEDNQLISWIAIRFNDTATYGKFWTITCIYSSKFTNYLDFNNPDIGLLLKQAYQCADEKQYYEYYYSIAERVAGVYERLWRKNKYVIPDRHTKEIVEVIPPMTQPDNNLYWRLMGSELKNDSIVIKKRVLKPEYRSLVCPNE
jgi:hypothetical protein